MLVTWLASCFTPSATQAAVRSPAEECEPEPIPGPDGRELFVRRWQVGDPRSFDGDGLGPVFNDVACAACHTQAGIGGGGGLEHNVFVFDLAGLTTRGDMECCGFGFRSRNTPALFGEALLDGIPDEAIAEAAATSDPIWPGVTGRVGRDGSGQLTRFGWKGDVATLAGFVQQACAKELGLELSTVAQAGFDRRAPITGYDLDDASVDALTGFVASLPAPVEDPAVPGRDAGARVFERVGCTACHAPVIGQVAGAYTDLLLHDMGASLADSASGYGASPVARASVAAEGPAQSGEWRTPPLWGVRDSGPWMHDGRAHTLLQAIGLHEGEAAGSSGAFLEANATEQASLVAFLDSLAARG